jgi:tRNA (pseudouridine54-N1)-methyltransferase
MRQFVLVAHDAPADGEFSLDDLPGAGRVDVLCRCITTALVLSHGIREDTRVWVVLGEALSVRFEGESIRRLNPDERSTGALLRNALAEREEAIGHIDAETSPGVFVSRRGLTAVLDAVSEAVERPTVVVLHEDGSALGSLSIPSDPVFVLSDHRDFTEGETELLAERADERVSVGPANVHANHAITVAHNYLDTTGYEQY